MVQQEEDRIQVTAAAVYHGERFLHVLHGVMEHDPGVALRELLVAQLFDPDHIAEHEKLGPVHDGHREGEIAGRFPERAQYALDPVARGRRRRVVREQRRRQRQVPLRGGGMPLHALHAARRLHHTLLEPNPPRLRRHLAPTLARSLGVRQFCFWKASRRDMKYY
uniref:Uncharacterized protein n=1 Tax=Oryza meridionalis TaxID=40149 RepID=A0A0E0BXD5_9ORYZ